MNIKSIEDSGKVYERFLSKITISPSGCWLFNSGFDEKGYTTISIHCRKKRTHRYSYETHCGPVPTGLTLDHLCGVRNCVNPEHLEAVTLQENIRRGGSLNALERHRQSLSMEERKGFMRGVQRRAAALMRSATHCKKGHPYEPNNAIYPKRRGRVCKICTQASCRAASRRYKERKRAVLANL